MNGNECLKKVRFMFEHINVSSYISGVSNIDVSQIFDNFT